MKKKNQMEIDRQIYIKQNYLSPKSTVFGFFLIKLQSQCINIDERVAKLLTSTKSNVWINEKETPQV